MRSIILISLVGIASAILSAQLLLYSLRTQTAEQFHWWAYFAIAAMGSAAALVGIVLGDSMSHSFCVGVMVRREREKRSS
eukprot:scaffold14075_cov72-Cyclotella_meneghiniana.AAC.12